MCKHVGRYGVNCIFCCRASRRFDICYVFISALELFKLYFKFFLACKLACFTYNHQRPCRARVFGWGIRFHFSHLSHSGAQNVFSPRGRHQTLRLLFRAAHPLVHESWSKIGIEIRQILFILRKKICHQFPTKFCQGLPNFNTPSSCLGAGQIFVRHEIWQICQFKRHDWRKMSIKKILSILSVRVF